MKMIIILTFCFGALLSCGGQKDSDKIGDAQICLDSLASPTYAQVQSCMDKVEGLTSSGAEGIRCSGGFIREGFGSPQRFVDAMQAIDNNTSGSSVQALMGILTFTSASVLATDYNSAVNTFNSCLASGGKGSTLLASYSYLTMSLVKYYNARNPGGCSGTPGTNSNGYKFYDITTCINNSAVYSLDLVDVNTVQADAIQAQNGIGAIVISSYVASCTGTNASSPLCELMTTSINRAGGTSSPRRVAVEFFSGALGL